ncbi:serine/threonine-protein kinase [Agromyces sp. NPDC058484]|uniref:serine/threonine-protein kinase n=1 Tax=Agromyces sp. NPDC058484 TaxID=3346524 RepID=UPI00365B45C2
MSTPSTLIADRYRLVKLLGTGGMGVVWEAWDERLERRVALKMLRTQPELTDLEREAATNRAMREARITAGLHHEHAVTVFDVVEHDGRPCLVMQLVESTLLSNLLREHGTLTPPETARIGAHVSSALASAHKMRIVHRDVKPGNVLITEDGSAMISDFGISHALGDATTTATGMMRCTPAYLAPEVASGQQQSSFASDVFSLGSTLYAMLEGGPPFGADDNAFALLHKVARGDFPASTHAGALGPLLRDMLSADPKRRPSMKSVASRLAAISQGTDAAASVLPTEPLGAAAADLVVDGSPVVTAEEPESEAPTVEAPTVEAQTVEALTVEAPTAEAPAAEAPAAEATTTEAPTAEAPAAEATTTEAPTAVVPAADTDRLAGAATSPPLAWLTQSPQSPPPTDEPTPGPPPIRRRRADALVGILVLVALLVLGGLSLFGPLRPDAGTAGGPGTEESPSTSQTPEAATETPATRSPEAQPPVAPSTPPQEAEEPPPAPPSAEQQVVDAVTTYYATVPGDLDTGWSMLTADYQQNHVGGRNAYGAFWGAVANMRISDVTASAADAAQATLVYNFTDGRAVREVTAYQLVDEGGVLKIAATEVISSVDLR